MPDGIHTQEGLNMEVCAYFSSSRKMGTTVLRVQGKYDHIVRPHLKNTTTTKISKPKGL